MKKHPARWLLAALSQAALASSVSHAQTAPTLTDTVVTASRIPDDATLLPLGVQVITGSEIREAGMTNARDAIRWLGGVVTRLDTGSGREPVLDLRGFGETASSNTVILVDGVRQNEGDMNPTVLGWIPVDSIERIEIVRGSGSVLHGEGATAGVINIITSKGLSEPSGSASFAYGSNATRDARASLNTQSGNWRYQVHANALNTDNHRNSFNTQERNALARATWADGPSLFSVQLGGQSSEGNQPGGLTPTDFQTRPRFAYNQNDRTQSEIQNLLVSAESAMGPWRLAIDLNGRVSTSDAQLDSFGTGYVSSSRTDSTRAALRGWREFAQNGVRHRFLMGIDSERWAQDSQNNFPSTSRIKQESDAVYARNEINVADSGFKAFAGARQTTSYRQAVGTWGSGALDVNNTAWELGAAKKVSENGEVFLKTGTSFRLPNANEYTCFDPTLCPTSSTNILRPQTSRDMEIGYRHASEKSRWSVRLYRNNLVDEIGFFGASNRNFDPTRRQGMEADLTGKLSSALQGGFQYAYRQATFRSGTYGGNEVPLVPKQSLSARLSYQMSATQQWLLTSQLVASQRIGDDFDNASASRIPGYGTVNIRYSQKVDAWTFAGSVNNLTDRAYYNYRTNVDASTKSVYPEAGRTFLVSAERRF